MSESVDLSYVLPTAIQSIQSSWITSSQSAAMVSALIAATDAQLLVFMKSLKLTDPNEPFSTNPTVYNVMLGFIYAGLFLSISATMSQLIITDIFGELPLGAARKACKDAENEGMDERGRILMSLSDLLLRYGAKPGFRWVTWHWFISFWFGLILSILSVLVYAGVEEPVPTKVMMVLVVLYSLIPFLHFYGYSLLLGTEKESPAAAASTIRKSTATAPSLVE